MKNLEQYAICEQRGHQFGSGGVMTTKWKQCKWCGVWGREVHTREEREDTPPEEEQDPLTILLRQAKGSQNEGEAK